MNPVGVFLCQAELHFLVPMLDFLCQDEVEKSGPYAQRPEIAVRPDTPQGHYGVRARLTLLLALARLVR